MLFCLTFQCIWLHRESLRNDILFTQNYFPVFFFFTFNEFAYFMAICVSSFRTVVQHSVRHTALDLPLLALSLVYNCSFGKKTNSLFFRRFFVNKKLWNQFFCIRFLLWGFIYGNLIWMCSSLAWCLTIAEFFPLVTNIVVGLVMAWCSTKKRQTKVSVFSQRQ